MDTPRDLHNSTSDRVDAESRPPLNLHTPSMEDRLPQHPLHYHNPWPPADPDSPQFTHRQWQPTPNTRITTTTFQSNTPGMMPDLLSMMNGGGIHGQAHPGASPFLPLGAPPTFPRHHHHLQSTWVPMRPPMFPGHVHEQRAPHFHHHVRPNVPGQHHVNATVNGMPFELNNLFQTLFNQPHPGHDGEERGTGAAPPSFANLLSSIFNPAALNGGQHGDAVYSDEAFDRLLTQFLEQNNASRAPGPAPDAAIAALPKARVEEKMMGSDGKAECSVCMENVQVGDEVTMLPCKHWFHGECVGAWLKEHNTCPHCRQGIVSTPTTPGATSQPSQQTMPGSFPHQHTSGPTSPTGPPGSSPAHPQSVPATPFPPSPSSIYGQYPGRLRTRSISSSASVTSGRNPNGGFHFSIQTGMPSSSRRRSPSHAHGRRREHSFSSSRSPVDEHADLSRHTSSSSSARHRRRLSRRGESARGGGGDTGNNTSGGITGWVRQRFGGS